MKKLLLALAVAAIGISGAPAQTIFKTINSAEMVNGYMNVFELPSNGGAYVFGSSWGIPDLNANFTSATNVVMSPNTIGDPNAFWYTPSGQNGALGNKIMEGNLYAQDDLLAGSVIQFDGTVSAFNLTTNSAGIPYQLTAFIRDFAPDYSSVVEAVYNLSGTGNFQLSLDTIDDPARHVQWGIQIKGPNIWGTDSTQLATAGSASIEAIPEPSTYAMLALGAAGLGAHLFRRRRR
jgi:hypothetical protein